MENNNSQDTFESAIKKEEEIYTSNNFRFIVNWERREVMIMSAKTDTAIPGVFVVQFDQLNELHSAIWEIKYMSERGF